MANPTHPVRCGHPECLDEYRRSLTDIPVIPGFPKLGVYQRDVILRGARWITTTSNAADMKSMDFVLKELGYSKPEDIRLTQDSLQAKTVKTLSNFFQLFEQGHSLAKSDCQPLDPNNPKILFDIKSPKDLLKANLAIQDLAEGIIFQGSKPSEIDRLGVTQTKFLYPHALSQMLQGAISPEEALLLISCLGLRKANKHTIVPVCNPMTGSFHEAFQPSMLASYNLVFLDPEIRLKELDEKNDYDNKKALETSSLLFEGTKLIAQSIVGMLGPLLDLPETPQLIEDLVKAGDDHEKVEKIIQYMEIRYDPNDPLVLKCQADILQATEYAFNKCRELVQKLPTSEDLERGLKNAEARARLAKAVQQKETLNKRFEEHKDTLLEYLKQLSKKREIPKDVPFSIKWKVQGAEVEEELIVTKSCSVSRRLHYARTPNGARSDLVYFSSTGDSVLSEWKALCKKHSISDSALADYLLLLYENGESDIPLVFLPFLSFLMALLLGKEPAFDTASIPANFIMLLSVKLGINSFEDALRKMPMIPQGAVAAKQFLLHVSGIPLDILARVQYKDKKQVSESAFLPTASTFLGSANEWIQVYDDVASTAISCCRHLFFNEINPQNPHLLKLRDRLKKLLDLDEKLEVWDIPNVLKAEHPPVIVRQKNACAAAFLIGLGQKVSQNPIEDCIQFLTQGIDRKDGRIQKIQQKLDEQNRENWVAFVLFTLDENDPSYEQTKKMISDWDPVAICKKSNMNPYDLSKSDIPKIRQAWIDHLKNYKIVNANPTLIHNYRIPLSYECLPLEMNPRNDLEEDDLIAKWAIEYLCDQHPLRKNRAS